LEKSGFKDISEYRILGMQQGRCTAEYRTDTVFLTAFSSLSGACHRDMTIIVKCRDETVRIAPGKDDALSASIFCGSFTNTKFDQILFTAYSGRDDLYGCLYSVKYGNVAVLFDSEKFGASSGYTAVHRDFFEVEIIGPSRERYLLELAKRRERFPEGIYGPDGRLLMQKSCAVLQICGLYPVYSEECRRVQLLAYRRVVSEGGGTLGFIVTRLYWIGRDFSIAEIRTAEDDYGA
jgi:hypothetical protein